MSCASAGLLLARSAATQNIAMFGDIPGHPSPVPSALAGAAARSRADYMINPILPEAATVKLVGVVGVEPALRSGTVVGEVLVDRLKPHARAARDTAQ